MFSEERYRAITFGNIARSDTEINNCPVLKQRQIFHGAPQMSFEDELKELISNANAGQEQQDKALGDFRLAWSDVKLNIVKPVLDRAAKLLEDDSQFSASVELHNGSISLKLRSKSSHPKQRASYELKFSATEETQTIGSIYVASEVVPESFTLDKFGQPTVENKVKEFLFAVLGQSLR
jgi:hypothetical protein